MVRKKLEHHERDKVRRPCVAIIRRMIALNQLRRYKSVYWTCPPDHGRVSIQHASQLKLNGYEKGNFDMTVIAASPEVVKVWLIEFKYGTNDYTAEQENVVNKFDNTPVKTIKIKSPDEFIEFLLGNL